MQGSEKSNSTITFFSEHYEVYPFIITKYPVIRLSVRDEMSQPLWKIKERCNFDIVDKSYQHACKIISIHCLYVYLRIIIIMKILIKGMVTQTNERTRTWLLRSGPFSCLLCHREDGLTGLIKTSLVALVVWLLPAALSETTFYFS